MELNRNINGTLLLPLFTPIFQMKSVFKIGLETGNASKWQQLDQKAKKTPKTKNKNLHKATKGYSTLPYNLLPGNKISWPLTKCVLVHLKRTSHLPATSKDQMILTLDRHKNAAGLKMIFFYLNPPFYF